MSGYIHFANVEAQYKDRQKYNVTPVPSTPIIRPADINSWETTSGVRAESACFTYSPLPAHSTLTAIPPVPYFGSAPTTTNPSIPLATPIDQSVSTRTEMSIREVSKLPAAERGSFFAPIDNMPGSYPKFSPLTNSLHKQVRFQQQNLAFRTKPPPQETHEQVRQPPILSRPHATLRLPYSDSKGNPVSGSDTDTVRAIEFHDARNCFDPDFPPSPMLLKKPSEPFSPQPNVPYKDPYYTVSFPEPRSKPPQKGRHSPVHFNKLPQSPRFGDPRISPSRRKEAEGWWREKGAARMEHDEEIREKRDAEAKLIRELKAGRAREVEQWKMMEKMKEHGAKVQESLDALTKELEAAKAQKMSDEEMEDVYLGVDEEESWEKVTENEGDDWCMVE